MKSPRSNAQLRLLFLGHRYLGLFVAGFVLLLSITGLMLNHTDDLSLDGRLVQSTWLLHWYGMETPEPGPGYHSEDRWFIEYADHLFMDEREISQQPGPLMGVAATPAFFIAAYPKTLLLIDHEGQIVEQIPNIPGNLMRIGTNTDSGKAMIETVQGRFMADSELLRWHPHTATPNAQWSTPQKLPETLKKTLTRNYQGQGLSLERLLLDLHSGRLFGRAGVIFMDGVALAFILLSVMGVWIWLRRG